MNKLNVTVPAFYTHTINKLKVTALFDGILYMHQNEMRGLSNEKFDSLISANPNR